MRVLLVASLYVLCNMHAETLHITLNRQKEIQRLCTNVEEETMQRWNSLRCNCNTYRCASLHKQEAEKFMGDYAMRKSSKWYMLWRSIAWLQFGLVAVTATAIFSKMFMLFFYLTGTTCIRLWKDNKNTTNEMRVRFDLSQFVMLLFHTDIRACVNEGRIWNFWQRVCVAHISVA